MPEARLQRTRDVYVAGYQFGQLTVCTCPVITRGHRVPAAGCPVHLQRTQDVDARSEALMWNVIEGDCHR